MFRVFQVSEHRHGNMKKKTKMARRATKAKKVFNQVKTRVDQAKKAYDDCRGKNGSVKDCMKKLTNAKKRTITQNDIPDVWHCNNNGCYLSEGKNEILVVISKPDDQGNFTWLRIYDGEYENDKEDLYWSRFDHGDYVLMDEYSEDLNVSRTDEYDPAVLKAFENKIGTVDTIASNIQQMHDILKTIS